MPESINSLHTILTLIAVGILFGAGFSLANLAIAWPSNRISTAAFIVCLLLVALAWAV